MINENDYPQDGMTGEDLKKAREALGLSQFGLGLMLGYKPTGNMRQQVSRMERGEKPVNNVHRRLIEAYLSGHRPEDWPEE
nr:helix-turn-helix transcriptional regulator [uncultured Cohaesibacter sp.]